MRIAPMIIRRLGRNDRLRLLTCIGRVICAGLLLGVRVCGPRRRIVAKADPVHVAVTCSSSC